MVAKLLDGKALSETLKSQLGLETAAFVAKYGSPPGLDVVLVGNDPASEIYTRNKESSATKVGLGSRLHKLPSETSEEDLLTLIRKLNADPAVDGILVQLPLPKHVRSEVVLDTIDPAKDVDGFHPINVGKLSIGRDDALVPCTPRGSMKLIALARADIAGAHAVIVGRSNIVGKPIAQLLLQANATVTVAHSKTADLESVCRTADILVAAIGKPEMIRAKHVKEGAIVIDVGINRVNAEAQGAAPGEKPKTKIVGDVAFEEVSRIASAITPVPGGVGPMTIACLLENTLVAARLRRA
ncbi:MAG: bifunctional methylenetetrahydrofolate dehydrogenase/methenyltetrahydrofolate cyclohydrolase FolD [Polyangiaceae bacterium]|nr:bifunctional methylenetetrahydrofolate dehydrogenase/methenyltetrahydrofolate cyclohydrolase FolD [Polyangiaceae bacterium]